jgi:hypothetical protein
VAVRAAAVVTLAALAASAARAADPPRVYRYEAEEMRGARTQAAHRMDFSLERADDGSLKAVVLGLDVIDDGGKWRPLDADEACRRAMHAPPGALAAVTLWPTREDPLGPAFLDACAPSDLFYSLTDLLNVVIIPMAPQFDTTGLRRPGDAARLPGFTAHFARYRRRFDEASPGGELVLVSHTPRETIVDWRPDPARLEIEEGGSTTSRLEGSEHWAFRVGFDTHTGVLRWAEATADDIELDVHAPPSDPTPAAHLSLTRHVRIDTVR